MVKNKLTFKEKYGPWAFIAGASDGLGEAFALSLAERGLNLVLIDKRFELLDALGTNIKEKYQVDVRTLQLDLSNPEMLSIIKENTSDIHVGLLVYVASMSVIGPFLKQKLEDHLKIIDVNCKGPSLLSYYFGKKMLEERKGGIILMSSISALQGSPMVTHYGASKAYTISLAEGLWAELMPHGIDVIASIAGQIQTPQTEQRNPDYEEGFKPYIMKSEEIVEETLKAMGKKGSYIPGRINRRNVYILRHFISRKRAVKIVGNKTQKMYHIEE